MDDLDLRPKKVTLLHTVVLFHYGHLSGEFNFSFIYISCFLFFILAQAYFFRKTKTYVCNEFVCAAIFIGCTGHSIIRSVFIADLGVTTFFDA